MFITGVAPINITKVNIPAVVRAGTEEPIILDCNYEMEPDKMTGLVIKWFVGNDLIYQWIYGREPTGSTEFRKYIDESFNASVDPITMYRAVKLRNLSKDINLDVKSVIYKKNNESDKKRNIFV